MASRCWCGVSLLGLPMCTPAAVARVLPSLVLALISSFSNSARPPRTVSINLPCGVVVSAQVSASDLKPAPRLLISCNVFRRSRVLLARRSSRVPFASQREATASVPSAPVERRELPQYARPQSQYQSQALPPPIEAPQSYPATSALQR